MGARVAWARLVVGGLIAFGCAGDGFDPSGLRGGSGPGEPSSGGSGGGSKTSGSSAGGTGGSDVRPSSGGTGSTASATGITAPSVSGGSGGTRPRTGGSGPSSDVSYCPDTAAPTLERVVASCVADSQTRDTVSGCISSLEPMWQDAAGRYLACRDCDQVTTQVDCLVRVCRNDADGVLTLQDLVQNCAWTVAAADAGLGT
ncbi:MAG: hypothetical protein JW940_04255 [Polyangiaceae bacterium]|nr:hypothetical protein [Polyangiaceae bacterium]